jgi:hypothetical protein
VQISNNLVSPSCVTFSWLFVNQTSQGLPTDINVVIQPTNTALVGPSSSQYIDKVRLDFGISDIIGCSIHHASEAFSFEQCTISSCNV